MKAQKIPLAPRRISWVIAVLMGLSPMVMADERLESLGVINGSVIQRGSQTELTPSLSGQAFFQYDVDESQPTIEQIDIPRAQLTGRAETKTKATEVIWVQIPVELVDAPGTVALMQVPLQVRVNGKAVPVMVAESSGGVVITLTNASRQVSVWPAGALSFVVPATYRGDIRTDIRMVERIPSDKISTE